MLSARILIADDSKSQCVMIERSLRMAGFYNIALAADGNETLAQFHAFKPELILMDLGMPGMDAIDLCRMLTREHAASVHIIVQSGTQHLDDRVQAFEAGAADFIAKPVYPPELVARVRTHLENRWLLRNLHEFRERLSEELNGARLMQESLLPSAGDLATLRRTMGLDIAAHCETSSELGGDIWGVRIIDEARLGIFIADFTGHGVASAINAFRLHAVLGESGIRFARPDLVAQALNVRFADALSPGSYATLFYGVIDAGRSKLDYAAAGAPPPVLIAPDGKLGEIDASGVPIGIKHWHDYPVRTLDFPPGSALCLYSDALLETPDAQGEAWESGQLLSVLRHCDGASSAGRLADIVAAFDAGRTRPLPDDLTVIVLQRAAAPSAFNP